MLNGKIAPCPSRLINRARTMFTGIVQATAGIAAIHDRAGLRTFTLDFPEGFCHDLAIGASVATDGVCLTVTEILSPTQANFDVMLQSLNITTLGSYSQGDRVNVERAAKDGAEIGGHPLSGHVDFTGTLVERREFDNNLPFSSSRDPNKADDNELVLLQVEALLKAR